MLTANSRKFPVGFWLRSCGQSELGHSEGYRPFRFILNMFTVILIYSIHIIIIIKKISNYNYYVFRQNTSFYLKGSFKCKIYYISRKSATYKLSYFNNL